MPSDAGELGRRLSDIFHHIALARRFASGLDLDEFKRSLLHVYAVTRCLEIISEASRRLPDDLKARHPTIPWRAMAAAGNVYRHEYEDVAAQRVWETLTGSLLSLRDAIVKELDALSGER